MMNVTIMLLITIMFMALMEKEDGKKMKQDNTFESIDFDHKTEK